MTKRLALFRCDGSPAIGAGHLTRCLAIAEALVQAGWRVAFIVNEEATSLAPSLATGAFALRIVNRGDDEVETLRLEARDIAELLVVDHYERDAGFESVCRSFVRKILVLEDGTGRDHDCDILVDAAAVDPDIYIGHLPPWARMLTGPTYALVRRAFVEKRPEALDRRDGRPVKKILVSFGATDPSNTTSIALAALEPFADDISIVVALSSRSQHLDDVRHRLCGRMQLAVDANMPELMTYADVAIGAAGASSYERAVLGLPSIIVMLAENQGGIRQVLLKSGAALDAGGIDEGLVKRLRLHLDGLIADRNQRTCLSRSASSLIDGEGGKRVVMALTEYSNQQSNRQPPNSFQQCV